METQQSPIADCVGCEADPGYSIVSRREYEKVVYEFNDTYVDYPRDKCVHELFMEQAERVPDKTALVFEDRRFTYRELDEMSNSLAYSLDFPVAAESGKVSRAVHGLSMTALLCGERIRHEALRKWWREQPFTRRCGGPCGSRGRNICLRLSGMTWTSGGSWFTTATSISKTTLRYGS